MERAHGHRVRPRSTPGRRRVGAARLGRTAAGRPHRRFMVALMPAFLFTDLESSTRLWEAHPDAMRGALASHDAILRECVDAAGGSVVKTTGDGIMAAFAAVADTIAACLAAQARLGATAWEITGPLRVRMGIHAGDAEHRDDDYYGPTVNRTARIMAAGHGGQVLLSGAAAALAGDALPAGAALRDLGEHRLKDLTQPEHLFQLVHADLQSDFPPPVTLDLRANNLPVQGTEFFGREAELLAVGAMLDDASTRLVTLTGPGGAGKTRLGLQVAAERLDRYDDGVFFVDLSHEREPEAVFDAVARVLGATQAGQGDQLQALLGHLRDRQVLLVLDNFEQVIEAAAGVADLLAGCRRLAAVVTSREALRVRAERVFPVPPLALPDPAAAAGVIARTEAVQLFAERAGMARPGFTLTDENAAAVADICIRLDGLPLAIELAAARLNVFSPGDLAARLRDRIDVVGSGARDLPKRQRTLRGTIEWSYDLLDRDECRLFELMSVFSTARLETVEAVAKDVFGDIVVLDVLASLVDKSLVRSGETSGSSRFSMLQTVREYAAERLAASPGTAAATRRAHAEYYSAYGRGLRQLLQGPERDTALDDLAAEVDNLRTAWRYWVAENDLEQLYALLDGLWALHDARGWYHATIELTTDMLAVLATSEPSPERAGEEMTLRVSLARALMAVRGYTVEVEEAFRQALALSEEAGDASHRFPVLRALGSYYTGIADFERCAEVGRELLDLADREDDEAMRIDGLLLSGISASYAGDLATGLSRLDQAVALFDPKTHGPSRFRLGASPGVVARVAASLTRWAAGDLEQAVSGGRDALDLARAMDHPFSLAYALYHTGFLEFLRQRFEVTRERANELAAVAAEHNYPIWGALARVLEGVAACGLGAADEGLALTEAGVDLYRGLTTPPVFWPLVLALRAFSLAGAGKPEAALALIDEAIAFTEGNEAIYPEFRVVRGDLILMTQPRDAAAAEDSYRAAIRGATQIGARLIELQATTRLVELLRATSATPDGSNRLRELYESFTGGLDEADLTAARATLRLD